MNEYNSTKIFNGYSTAFRQWGANHSHCQFLHGYALEFKVTFSGDLDQLNWVCDFGSFKRNGIKDHMSHMFDHTTIVAENDPHLEFFKELSKKNIIQLRIMDGVGCEKFATYVFEYINKAVIDETNGRVQVLSVECFEGGTDNSAIYKPVKVNKSTNKINYNKKEII